MKLKTRILIQTLSASLALTVLLGLVFFFSIARIRDMALTNADELGRRAALAGAVALEKEALNRGVTLPVAEVNAAARIIEEEIRELTAGMTTSMDDRILFFAGVTGLALFAGLFLIALLAVRFTAALTGPILTQNIEEIERATAERQRLETEMDIATRIQMSMLPADFPPFPDRRNDFDLFAAIRPAREIGGDFYDFFFIDDEHFAVIIADVSGKGVPAAIFMTITKMLIKNRLEAGEQPDRALENVNRELYGRNIEGMFVTLWLGILEISSGRLRFINAGHNPPLVGRGWAKDYTFLRSAPDVVLAAMDDTSYHVCEEVLEDGDTLFLYTDGITEAEGAGEELYSKERLKRLLESSTELSLRDLLPALQADVAAFSLDKEQADDITMLAIRMDRKQGGFSRAITLPAEIAVIEDLFDFIKRNLEEARCPEKERGHIELAAEEIFVNIASYAYRNLAFPAEERWVIVFCEVEKTRTGTTFTLSFADRGEPFNPLERPDPEAAASLEEQEPGGLGLLLVQHSMDMLKYSYEDDMNRLIMKKTW